MSWMVHVPPSIVRGGGGARWGGLVGGLGGPCGIVGYDELGRDVVAKTFHKQFVDRCWRSSTATRSAAAKDLSQAPGTTATGSN